MPMSAGNRLIVILNDNDMSIAPPVGGLRNSLARLVSSNKYLAPRALAQKLARARCPDRSTARRARSRNIPAAGWTGGTLFEELGFYYVGPVDGHNVEALVEVLENVRDAEEGPILVHVVTKKGKGYAPGRERRRQISWRGQVRRRLGQAGQGPGRRPAELYSTYSPRR